MVQEKYRKLNSLVEKAQAGSDEAFTELAEKQAQMIRYSCIRYMGNELEGEDAAQEVVIRMYEKLENLQNPEAFIVWLQKIIMSVCNNLKSKLASQTEKISLDDIEEKFEESDASVLPESFVADTETRQDILAIVNDLPKRAQECMTLYYYSELSVSEIAEVLGISEGSVKAHLFRGRKGVKDVLDAKEQEEALLEAEGFSLISMQELFIEDSRQGIGSKRNA